MIPSSEIRGIHCLSPDTPLLLQASNSSNDFPNLHLNTLLTSLSALSSSSTSDDALADDRKQRRMISNRESARRSRMRKQRHLDELWSQVLRLRSENHNLIHKLNHVSESHNRVLQENARLREEASDLRQLVADLQIQTFADALRDFDDIPS